MSKHGAFHTPPWHVPGEQAPQAYRAAQWVKVHAFGHWYDGLVIKTTGTKIHVRYTSGSGTTRLKVCNPSLVRTLVAFAAHKKEQRP